MKLTIYSEPLNDNSMVFNTKTKKYELTIQEVKANFEIPFTDDGVLEARIKKNSRAVYGYIYAMGAPCNKRLVDYMGFEVAFCTLEDINNALLQMEGGTVLHWFEEVEN